MMFDAPPLPDEEIEGELIDPEDVPISETIWVARHLDVVFDGRMDTVQTVPLATGIDASEFVSLAAACILHSANTWASKAQMRVVMQAVELDPVEPDVAFLGPSIVLANLEIPELQVADVSVLPPRIQISLEFVVDTTEATVPMTGSLSVKLVLRRHAPVRYRVFSPPRPAQPRSLR